MSHDVYLYYEPEGTRVAKTVPITAEGLHTPINVDIGHEGQLVGVEALDVDTIEVNGQRPLLPIVPDPSACRALWLRAREWRVPVVRRRSDPLG
jgi:hypothetical protein